MEKAATRIVPSEEMMRAYYDNSPKIFIKPAKTIVKEIIIPAKDKDGNSFSEEKIEEQKKLADMILEKILFIPKIIEFVHFSAIIFGAI